MFPNIEGQKPAFDTLHPGDIQRSLKGAENFRQISQELPGFFLNNLPLKN